MYKKIGLQHGYLDFSLKPTKLNFEIRNKGKYLNLEDNE